MRIYLLRVVAALFVLGQLACGPGSTDATTTTSTDLPIADACNDGVTDANQLCLFSTPTDLEPARFQAGDFDGDGHIDLASFGLIPDGYQISMWLGDGAGGFSTTPLHANLEAVGTIVVVVELNDDANSDVLIVDASSGTLTSFLNTGNWSFDASLESAPADGGAPWNIALPFDANGDGRDDILVEPALGGTRLEVLSNPGDGSFATSGLSAPVDESCSFTAAANLPPFQSFSTGLVFIPGECADQAPGHPMSVMWAKQTGEFVSVEGPALGTRPLDVAAGDFDDDGTPDLLVWNGGTRDLDHFRANFAGNFEHVETLELETMCRSCTDTNVPNALGLGGGSFDGRATGVLLSSGGTLHIGLAPLSENSVWNGSNASPNHTVTSDFNNDGHDDILLEYNAEKSVLLLLSAP